MRDRPGVTGCGSSGRKALCEGFAGKDQTQEPHRKKDMCQRPSECPTKLLMVGTEPL